jgi:hypothetical protein
MDMPSKPKKKKKAGRPRQPEPASFLFEIKDWEPSYDFSVDYDRRSNNSYNEYMQIDFNTVCLSPEKYQGRIIKFTFDARRDCLEPQISKIDPNWKPNCVGSLELPKAGGGSFYPAIPHDSMGFIVNAIARGMLQFVHLWGGEVKRNRCLSKSIRLMKSFDPDDY